MPLLIHIRGTDRYELAWLQTVLDFIVHETQAAKPGVEAVVDRLTEVLFIEIVRAYVQQSAMPLRILAALSDKQIGAALNYMHRTPGRPWTLDALAGQVGMSRSAVASRFKQLVRQTPMQYLTFWRMQKARELLTTNRLSTPAVAKQVGYQSDVAFSIAFKKIVGEGPGAFRRTASRRR